MPFCGKPSQRQNTTATPMSIPQMQVRNSVFFVFCIKKVPPCKQTHPLFTPRRLKCKQRDAAHIPWCSRTLRPTDNSPSRQHCNLSLTHMPYSVLCAYCSTSPFSCQEDFSLLKDKRRGALLNAPTHSLVVLCLALVLVLILSLVLVLVLILILIFCLFVLVLILLIRHICPSKFYLHFYA